MADTTKPRYLFLLPIPPQPSTYTSLRTAYTPSLTALLAQLSTSLRRVTHGCTLEIALPIPFLAGTSSSRSTLYPLTQTLLAQLYKLICVIAARSSVNIEDAAGIDVRVSLLAYSGSEPVQTGEMPRCAVDVVVGLQTLARSQRPWTAVYAVEGEEAEEMVRLFLINQDGRVVVRRLPAGQVVDGDGEDAYEGKDMNAETEEKSHYSVAVGGTFDHIHFGHKLLLTMFAFMLASPKSDEDGVQVKRGLTIGITGDELLKNKNYAELLESWEDRARIVGDFMRGIMDFRPAPDNEVKMETKNEKGLNGHAVHTLIDDLVIKCVELSDPFGPTVTDQDVSALVVSAETRKGGEAINERRRERGWHGLETHEVDVLDASEFMESTGDKDSFDAKLSSTTIRKMLSERADKDRKKPP